MKARLVVNEKIDMLSGFIVVLLVELKVWYSEFSEDVCRGKGKT